MSIDTMDNLTYVNTPHAIVAGLIERPYDVSYQPRYNDRKTLEGALGRVQQIESVASPESVQELRSTLGRAAIDGFIVLEASCAEPVGTVSVEQLADAALATNRAVRISTLGQTSKPLVYVQRNRSQAGKPRSSATEMVTATTETISTPAGQVVPTFMGEGVNGEPIDQRTPDPARLVVMATQAHDLEEQLTKALGSHMPAAHEALLLPYEKAQIMQDNEGDRYLLSADLPWIGARTNDVDGDHVAMLSGIVNPVGVKISASSDEKHIKELADRLNPNNETGKLVFMLRLGAGNKEKLDTVLDGIRDYAPNAIIMYDIHGVTKTIDGRKIRVVTDVIDEIIELTHACNEHGLRMSGVHLETMADSGHKECIDKHGDVPTRPGYVDPRLNPGQLTHVLNAIAATVLNQQLTESSSE